MTIALIWLTVGVVLLVAELLSGDLFLAALGGAAVGTAGASAAGVPLGADVGVFAALAAVLVLLARPALRRRLGRTPEISTGVLRLIGAQGEVLETVGVAGGTVRLPGGEWSARTLDDDARLAVGSTVVVVAVEGATAIVAASASPYDPVQEN